MPVYDEVGIGIELTTGLGTLLGLLSPEATGDEDTVGRSCGRFGLDAPATQGLMAAIFDSIGESLDEVGGHRITRLIDDVAIGESFFPVENCIDWESSGRVAIDGVPYNYSHKGDGTLAGITHSFTGSTVIGAMKAHSRGSEVLDLGNPYSVIELARRSMITEYADGDDLNVIARNYGIDRPLFYASDATFRAAVRAVAFNPRGTIYGLELALDALVGAGNYVITEDLIGHPCTVFITILNDTLRTPAPFGKFYLGDPERAALGVGGGGAEEVAITAPPCTGGNPQSICWVPHEYFVDCRIFPLPSLYTSVEFDGDPGTAVFSFVGTLEAAQVTFFPGSHVQIDDTNPPEVGYYETLLRTNELGQVEWSFSVTFMVPAGTVTNPANTDQVAFKIADGEIETGFGCTNIDPATYLFGVIDGWPAYAVPLLYDTWHTCEMKRRGNRVDVLLDSVLLLQLDVSFFLPSVNKYFAFGCFDNTTSPNTVNIRQVGLSFYSHHDYFAYEADDATLGGAGPNRLVETNNVFVAGDVGKQVRTVEGAANPQGGNNAGRWIIATVNAANDVDLVGPDRTGAQTDTANGSRITVPLKRNSFVFPDDLGKKIVLSGSALGNDGTYTITTLLDPDDPSIDLASWDTPIQQTTNVCEVAAAPPFVTETDLDWHLEPNFVNEVNRNWNLSDAGSVIAGPKVELRGLTEAQMPGCLEVMEVAYSRVLTGQIMGTSVPVVSVVAGLYSHYPLYITDPLGMLRAFLDDLTAAGVIPEYDEAL